MRKDNYPILRHYTPRSRRRDRWPSFEQLLSAYRSCRLKKTANASQSRFERHLGQSLLQLQEQIHAGTYQPSPMKCFVVEEPKPREIFAAEFRDRVVHHLVITVMEPIWERKFVYSSFACRKGKGVHGALKYFQAKVREISRGGRSRVGVLQLDLARFFVTIHRPTLCHLMEKHAPFPEIKEMIQILYLHDGRVGAKIENVALHQRLISRDKSWFSQPKDCGLPIGNLTSQFGANVYLNGLDHFIQRTLKPSAYIRYMDDLLLIDRDAEVLRTLEKPIDCWLETYRHQRLNPVKSKLVPLSEGVTYLGYHAAQIGPRGEPLRIFPTGKKKWKFIRALQQLSEEIGDEPFSIRPHPLAPYLVAPDRKKKVASINSRFGHLVHSQSYIFRKRALKRFERNIGNSTQPSKVSQKPGPLYEVKEGYHAIRLRESASVAPRSVFPR